ncbi:DUF2818 family protein [Castellaniella sp. GW247-6E4]|uniref:DUF2818 family protein n=1 Tax=Castellaniella sp. GW247-6E4 TaxID=3140380 RepID=UPI003314B905
MDLSAAAWSVIVLALVAANLPFVIERPLVSLPWLEAGAAGAGRRWLRCLLFFALAAAWVQGTLILVGGAFAGGGDTAPLFLLKLVLVCALAAGLLALPGWRAAAQGVPKSFFDRLLETLVCYVLVGTLGLALELNLGNAFARTWEFYAVSLSLFLVMGYPGFVFRYMLKRRKGAGRKST